MLKIELQSTVYQLEKDYKNGFDLESVKHLYTDYFEPFDYIVGDWAYGKLRLKGFCKKGNNIYNHINDIHFIDDYLENQCAYDCRYFILKKVKEANDKNEQEK